MSPFQKEVKIIFLCSLKNFTNINTGMIDQILNGNLQSVGEWR